MSFRITTRVHSVKQNVLPYAHLDNVFTDKELQDVLSYCTTLPLEDARIGQKTLNVDYRKSKVHQFKVNKDNEWIFDRLQIATDYVNNEFFRYDLIGFDQIQYTEYRDDNNLYDFHVDCYMGPNTPPDHSYPRKLSFSLILSDSVEYKGGEFEVMYSKKPEELTQKKGRLLAFPSHMLHRVKPVTAGTRKSLVFWVIGPKLK